MTIGILKEPDFENRVSLLPEAVKTLFNLKTSLLIEKGSGLRSHASDKSYEEAGGKIADRKTIIDQSDVLLSLQAPSKEILSKLKKGQIVISVFNPLSNKEIVDHFFKSEQTAFSMDMIHRTSRGQSMDILSSIATI